MKNLVKLVNVFYGAVKRKIHRHFWHTLTRTEGLHALRLKGYIPTKKNLIKTPFDTCGMSLYLSFTGMAQSAPASLPLKLGITKVVELVWLTTQE